MLLIQFTVVIHISGIRENIHPIPMIYSIVENKSHSDKNCLQLNSNSDFIWKPCSSVENILCSWAMRYNSKFLIWLLISLTNTECSSKKSRYWIMCCVRIRLPNSLSVWVRKWFLLDLTLLLYHIHRNTIHFNSIWFFEIKTKGNNVAAVFDAR